MKVLDKINRYLSESIKVNTEDFDGSPDKVKGTKDWSFEIKGKKKNIAASTWKQALRQATMIAKEEGANEVKVLKAM